MKNLKFILPVIFAFVSKQLLGSASVAWTNVHSNPGGPVFTASGAVKTSANITYVAYSDPWYSTFTSSVIEKIYIDGTTMTSVTTTMKINSLAIDYSTNSIYAIGGVKNTIGKFITCIEKYNSNCILQWRRTVDFSYGSPANVHNAGEKGAYANGYLYVSGFVYPSDTIYDEDWTVTKVSETGVIGFTDFKKIAMAGHDFPTDCGFLTDNSGASAFYVCGLMEQTSGIYGRAGMLMKFSTSLDIIWSRSLNQAFINAVDEWYDMEIFNNRIYLAGMGSITTTIFKPVCRVYTPDGVVTNQILYDPFPATPTNGTAKKVKVDFSMNIYLGLNDAEFSHVVKYSALPGTNPLWDVKILPSAPIQFCNPSSLFYNEDIALSPNGLNIFAAGTVNECSSGFPKNIPWTVNLATNTGNIVWSDFTSLNPVYLNPGAKYIFGISTSDCIIIGNCVQGLGTWYKYGFVRRYTTVTPRLDNNIDGTSDLSDPLSINLNPNPTGNTLHIAVESEINKISIYDLTGSVVKEYNQEMFFEADLDVSFLKPGVYMLLVATKEKQTAVKFIKQ
ncbi:MAG TPA: T9SS type A sorting domain-containing protein [Bacteroidia bacterium]|nr:T9SS type A sorting domain-containing protein [Bacteroidia bacterium]